MTTPIHPPTTAPGTLPPVDPLAPNTSADPSRTPRPQQHATDVPSRLSPSTAAGYAADWALFTDWAAAVDQLALPATPEAVLAFLQDCPAAQATHRRRVISIDHHHAAVGQPAPGSTDEVRAALGRRVGEWTPNPAVVDQVHEALLGIPSHGWTGGFFGRRDRLILTLTHLAGLTFRDQHHLTGADLQVTDGALVVTSRTRTVHLPPNPDPGLCPACTAVRWVNALHVVVTRPAITMLASPMQRAGAVTANSAHLCAGETRATDGTGQAPLFVPIDRYGGTTLPLRALAPPALANLARLDHSRVHPSLAPTMDTGGVVEQVDSGVVLPSQATRPRSYSRSDRDAQLAKRAAERSALTDVVDTLDRVDAALAELDERIKRIISAG